MVPSILFIGYRLTLHFSCLFLKAMFFEKHTTYFFLLVYNFIVKSFDKCLYKTIEGCQ